MKTPETSETSETLVTTFSSEYVRNASIRQPGRPTLPHGNMLLFDREIMIERPKDAESTEDKNKALAIMAAGIPVTESFLENNPFKGPEDAESYMYQSLIMDNAWQLVGFYLREKGYKGLGRAMTAGEITFENLALLGTSGELEYQVSIESQDKRSAKALIEVFHDGKLVMKAKDVEVSTLPEKLVDKSRKNLDGIISDDFEQKDHQQTPLSEVWDPATLEKENGVLKASKKIQPSDWWFSEHFRGDSNSSPQIPGDPVMPGAFGAFEAPLRMIAAHMGWNKGARITSVESTKFIGQVFQNPKELDYQLEILEETEDEIGVNVLLRLKDKDGEYLNKGEPIYKVTNLRSAQLSKELKTPAEKVAAQATEASEKVRGATAHQNGGFSHS